MIKPEIRERYLRDPVPIRLGGLAADLARVVSFSEVAANRAVESLIEESRAFIEWVAPDIPIDDAAELVEIQRGLTHWYYAWPQVQNDPDERHKLAEQAQQWSERVLAMSGLLD